MDATGTALTDQPVRFTIRIRPRPGQATQQYVHAHGRWSAVSGGTAFRLYSTEASDLLELYDELIGRGLDVTAIRRAR